MRTYSGGIEGWFNDQAGRDLAAALSQGLNLAVEHLDGEVQPRTPYLTGRLDQSKVVHHSTPSNLEAGISFHTPYARRQHELATPNRATYVNAGASHKYLEGPFNEQQATMQRIIATAVDRGMRE